MKVADAFSDVKLYNHIKSLVRDEQPVVFTTRTFSRRADEYMENVLSVFLDITQRQSIKEYLVYFVRELMTNAKKANTKRVYFAEKNLDLNKEEDYRRGMKNFKEDMIRNKNHYFALLEKEGLYIRLTLRKEARSLKIEVSNNARITSAEEIRLRNNLDMGGRCGSLEDALSGELDDTEGAGLGLIILVLLMKKLGMEKERMWIETGESETKIGVEIPSK